VVDVDEELDDSWEQRELTQICGEADDIGLTAQRCTGGQAIIILAVPGRFTHPPAQKLYFT